jgi:hypothetical protein
MRFFIDKEARKAYLFADTLSDEMSLRLIFAHLTGPFPNNIFLWNKEEQAGLQAVPMHLEMIDRSNRK